MFLCKLCNRSGDMVCSSFSHDLNNASDWLAEVTMCSGHVNKWNGLGGNSSSGRIFTLASIMLDSKKIIVFTSYACRYIHTGTHMQGKTDRRTHTHTYTPYPFIFLKHSNNRNLCLPKNFTMNTGPWWNPSICSCSRNATISTVVPSTVNSSFLGLRTACSGSSSKFLTSTNTEVITVKLISVHLTTRVNVIYITVTCYYINADLKSEQIATGLLLVSASRNNFII